MNEHIEEMVPIVLHIPHSSTCVPDELRSTLLVDNETLRDEILRLTDHFTDELFCGVIPGAAELIYPYWRLVVDPERFDDDKFEPASVHGMGVIYLKGSRGQPLRAPLMTETRELLLERFYRPHHRRLAEFVARRLECSDRCLVIDSHSFPKDSLPIECSSARPDICIGTDGFHTPPTLRDAAVHCFRGEGLSVGVDEPFAGDLVPLQWHQRDPRVSALMIEVGRWLYMDERSGVRHTGFEHLRGVLERCLPMLVAVMDNLASK